MGVALLAGCLAPEYEAVDEGTALILSDSRTGDQFQFLPGGVLEAQVSLPYSSCVIAPEATCRFSVSGTQLRLHTRLTSDEVVEQCDRQGNWAPATCTVEVPRGSALQLVYGDESVTVDVPSTRDAITLDLTDAGQ